MFVFSSYYNCLFLRLFIVKKNGIFFFSNIFFRIAIFTFMYYANEESDDVIGGSIKAVQHSIDIKAVFFKHGTRNVHHKSKKMTCVVLLS